MDIYVSLSLCVCKRVTRLICMSLLSVIDSFRRDQAAIESTWSTPLAWRYSPQFTSPYTMLLSLTLALSQSQSQQPCRRQQQSWSCVFVFLFCRVVSDISFYLSLSLSRCQCCALAPLSVCCLCEGAWARERKQRAVSFGSAVRSRSWRYVNYVYKSLVYVWVYVCECIRPVACNNNIKGKNVVYCRAVCGD